MSMPSQEDKTKLHAEINQLTSHTVLLNISAIALFAALVATILTKYNTDFSSISNITVLECDILLAVLLGLFLIGHTYLSMVRFYASYLRVTGASVLEQHYKEYCEETDKFGQLHLQYNEARTILFMILGLIAGLLPLLLNFVTKEPFETIESLYVLLFILVIYVAVVGYYGTRRATKIGGDADVRWRAFLANKSRRDVSKE